MRFDIIVHLILSHDFSTAYLEIDVAIISIPNTKFGILLVAIIIFPNTKKIVTFFKVLNGKVRFCLNFELRTY